MNESPDPYDLPVTYYSVVQYVPDIVAGECINIGILAFDDSVVESHFLENWKRVECFASGRRDVVRNLKRVVREIKSACYGDVPMPRGHLSPADIPMLTKRWEGSVQFSEPRASFRSRQDVLQRMSATLLKDIDPEAKAEFKTRQSLRKVVTDSTRLALKKRLTDLSIKKVLNIDYRRPGIDGLHKLDATLINGIPVLSVHGFSMQVHGWESVRDQASWAVCDIYARDGENTNIIMAVAPPTKQGDLREYNNFVRLCERKGALCPTDIEAPGVIGERIDRSIPRDLEIA